MSSRASISRRVLLSLCATVLALMALVVSSPTASAATGDTPGEAYNVSDDGFVSVYRDLPNGPSVEVPPANDPATVAVAKSCNAGRPLYHPLWVRWTVNETTTSAWLVEGRTAGKAGVEKVSFASITALLTNKLDVIDCSASESVSRAGPTVLTPGQVVYVLHAATVPFRCSVGDCQLFANQYVAARRTETTTPVNDDWQNATPITSLPFSQTIDTSTATEQAVDDTLNANPCEQPGYARPRRTVWFAFTPAEDGNVSFVDPSQGTGFNDQKVVIARLSSAGPDWFYDDCRSSGSALLRAGRTYLLQASTPVENYNLPDDVNLGRPVTVTVNSGPRLGRPDLVVTNVLASPTNAAAGTPTLFRATVQNKGSAPTPGGVRLGVVFKVDGVARAWSDTFNGSLGQNSDFGGSWVGGEKVTLTANGGPAGTATWPATAGPHTVEAIVDDVNRITELDEANNARTLTITGTAAPAKPNLVVTDVKATPAAPDPGQAVRFAATLKNLGQAAKPAGAANRVLFKVDGTSRAWSTNSTVAIPAGGSVTVTSNAGPNGGNGTWPAVKGEHTVQAVADDTSLVTETDEADNTRSVQLKVGAVASLPDLVVTNVSWTPGDVRLDTPLRFSATVTNVGTRSTPSGTVVGVLFRPSGSQSGPTWSDTWTKPLRPGQTVTLTANGGSTQGRWIPRGTQGAVKVTATVDDVGRIAESDEFNNDLETAVVTRNP